VDEWEEEVGGRRRIGGRQEEVPDLLGGREAPEIDGEGRSLRDIERRHYGEVEGKPREHGRSEGLRVDTYKKKKHKHPTKKSKVDDKAKVLILMPP